jgi:FlaA1/EpsC-like NDP-sugar epimerase
MATFLETFSRSILTLPRSVKKLIVLLTDIALCIITLWISFYIRLDYFVSLKGTIALSAICSVALALPIFWLFGLYKTIFRHSGKSSLISISISIIVYGLLYFSVISIYGFKNVPRSIGLIQPMLLFFAIAISRLSARYLLDEIHKNKSTKSLIPKVLVYGAGSAGRQLVSALENSNEMNVVGFVDDDHSLHGQILKGKNIYSSSDLGDLIKIKEVTYILLALPSVKRSKRMKILSKINKLKVIVRTLPSVSDLVEERVSVSDIRDLDISDLLGRESVTPDEHLLSKNINSKIVLVSGAGGSIGSELCRQIIKFKPKKIILVEISEYALYKINLELNDIREKFLNSEEFQIIPLLASVQDEKRFNQILETYKPQTIYHAAAYKHVSLVEENVCEGVKNNVFGTVVAAKAAIKNHVLDFVLVSSDKAVRPTNIMGASKRLAEICLQSLAEDKINNKQVKFCMVRFGNVLDSSGSIIPKFKKQIRDGGPVTLTHSDVTRYFMTIPEAAELVIQAGAMSKGSDVFVLDMGKPVKIYDLIIKIVTLSGLSIQSNKNPEGDISIKIIGLRPGEKLYEELSLGENPKPTSHSKILRAQDPTISWTELEKNLKTLKEFTHEGKVNDIKKFLQIIIKEYNPNSNIVDQLYTEQKKLK